MMIEKKPSSKKNTSLKTQTLSTTTRPRKLSPKVKDVNPVEESPLPKDSTTLLTTPFRFSTDTSPFLYHLKWHEAGIDFELHSSDARFMSQQSWKVQEALAGLLPLKKVPKKNVVDKVVPSSVRTSVATSSLTSSPTINKGNDADLEQFKAWVEASSARHLEQEEVAHQVFPNLKTYTPALAKQDSERLNPLNPPIPSAVDTLIQQTQQAFYRHREESILETGEEKKPAFSEETPIFSTLLNDFHQTKEAILNVASSSTLSESLQKLDFKTYLDQARFNDITEVLLLAGEYLRSYEHQSTFGSSQLKHLVENAQAGHINHAVLERALAQRYIEVVPDLTGNATSMEYRLTQIGRTYVQQLKRT